MAQKEDYTVCGWNASEGFTQNKMNGTDSNHHTLVSTQQSSEVYGYLAAQRRRIMNDVLLNEILTATEEWMKRMRLNGRHVWKETFVSDKLQEESHRSNSSLTKTWPGASNGKLSIHSLNPKSLHRFAHDAEVDLYCSSCLLGWSRSTRGISYVTSSY